MSSSSTGTNNQTAVGPAAPRTPPMKLKRVRVTSTPSNYQDRLLPLNSPNAHVLLSPTKRLNKRLNASNSEQVDEPNNPFSPTFASSSSSNNNIGNTSKSVLTYKSPTKQRNNTSNNSLLSSNAIFESPTHAKYQTTPLNENTIRLLTSPRKNNPKISKTPYKVLDAPDLQDDFYLNLVDWGSENVLSVGLGTCVYLWNATTSDVVKLCDLGPFDSITSVNWSDKGSMLAVGTNKGHVQIWDVRKQKKVRVFQGHKERVGTCSWSGDVLSSGSRDRSIHHHDVRVGGEAIHKYTGGQGHVQEVCGLKWNSNTNLIASGGNDNKLLVWDWRKHAAVYSFRHAAAVKALSWSPTQSHLLSSGGGTADRTIKFWNTSTGYGNLVKSIDTGSQVCNIAWSQSGQELVSTHGYSQHQIVVWKYSNMQNLATLTGHTMRVLYLATSPDGQNIVTGAGDETLRFWNVFRKSRRLDQVQRTVQLR